MSRRLGSNLAKLLQVLNAQVIPSQMQHGVLQGTRVSIGEDETIAIDPSRIGGAVAHGLAPEQVSHGSATHGGTRMAGTSRLRLIGRDTANRIHALAFERRHGENLRSKDTDSVLNLKGYGKRNSCVETTGFQAMRRLSIMIQQDESELGNTRKQSVTTDGGCNKDIQWERLFRQIFPVVLRVGGNCMRKTRKRYLWRVLDSGHA